MSRIQPFEVDVDGATLDDLRERLGRLFELGLVHHRPCQDG